MQPFWQSGCYERWHRLCTLTSNIQTNTELLWEINAMMYSDRRKRSAVGVAAVVGLALLLFAACASAVSSLIYEAETPPVVVWDHSEGDRPAQVNPDRSSHSTSIGMKNPRSSEALMQLDGSAVGD